MNPIQEIRVKINIKRKMGKNWIEFFPDCSPFYWILANMRSSSPFVNVITVGLP